MSDLLEQLEIRKELVEEIRKTRDSFSVEETQKSRIPMPDTIYYGREIWEQAVSALLCGKNLLLVGHKATGKNIFAENLAGVFQRPKWDISFHVATDAASLIEWIRLKMERCSFVRDRFTMQPNTEALRF